MSRIGLILVGLCVALAPLGTEEQSAKRLQGFSVVLLLGEMQASPTPEALSAPARKALADIKDFLPFKGYRVLDTQWSASTEGGTAQGRLRGVDNEEYSFKLIGTNTGPQRAFSLATIPVLAPNAPGPQVLLNTTFMIDVGETIVVGTSRIQGDKALVVLLTAVPGK